MTNFPSATFLEDIDANGHVSAVANSQLQRNSASVPLQADVLDRMKAFLRAKCNLVECTAADKEEARMLTGALSSWTKALSEPVKSEKLARQTQYSVRQLWHAFMTSRFVKGTAFHKALEHVCGAQWPGLLASVEPAAGNSGPSASTLRRAQFMVDMALMLSAQTRNARENLPASTGQGSFAPNPC